MDFIRLEVEGPTAVVTVDRPKALNALSSQTLLELEAALRQCASDRALRALIVTGAGEKAFVAGADISEMTRFTTTEALAFAELGHRVLGALEGLTIPTIAAVNGYALGGGCELALACDIAYASSTAKLGLPEVGLGVMPGFGGTQRLTRLVGRARAKELIFSGEAIDAQKAKEIGLVLEVVPPAELMPRCKALAAVIARRGPVGIAQAKRVIQAGAELPLSAANELERQAFGLLFGTADQKEGMAAFIEKRDPQFKHR